MRRPSSSRAPGGLDGSPPSVSMAAAGAAAGNAASSTVRSPITATGGTFISPSLLLLRRSMNNPYYFASRTQPSHQHQHQLTNRDIVVGSGSTAGTHSPMRKSKRRTSVGGSITAGHTTLMYPDDRKRDDTDRVDKLAQQQQQTPQSDSGLMATENTPTVLRRRAQYSQGKPRPIPVSLRTGSDAIAVAAAVDTFYTTPFLQLACREATEREVAARLRLSVQKMSSKLHTTRVEGLKEATAQLLRWTTQASIESAEQQQEQLQLQQTKSNMRHAGRAAEAAPAGQCNVVLPPYDAVRVEVLGGPSPAAAHGYYQHRPLSSESPRRRESEAAAARYANALRSPSWDVVQHALEGVDYTNSIFNTIFVPRLEVRNAMSTGVPISVQLPSDVALQWTTLPTTSRSAAGAAAGAAPQRAPPSQENELLRAATAVTYEEQELALRYIQGTCLVLYHQRRCCSEGCLLYYATEVFQCMRSHIDALFTSQRRELEEQEGEEQKQQRGKGGLGARTSGPWVATTTAALTSTSREAGRSQVSVDPSLVRVVVALVDAVEAACHYNPSSLRRLVQTGGVTAMLNLAYCPFMPTPIRAAVLNTISVLLQQVTPLRRYVAAASKPQEIGARGRAVEQNSDPLLQRMLENAVHDNPLGRDGKQIPYSTDFGSASKFDSAVRDWFFANGLGNVIASVAQLQDLRNTFQPTSFIVPQGPTAAAAATMTHANMLREGELHRKRIGWLLECMDGRELR
ncbi:hypothetical protein JIQ42_06856 [Leishmania sp. Namibia]|uniref:hypothetical protein n=1 Tax=Leishmania sp. Namibia TaxID=2802991 RepID=UPI001B46A142|nr:hypothetical protein JIQ42_06856 [Leishmania sp. Namibia]